MFKFKNRLLLVVSSILLITGSCNNFLDLKPVDNLVQQEFWKNKEQVNSAVAACYASMNETGYMDRVIMWGELRAEMLVSVKASTDQNNMMMNYMIPTSSIVNWSAFYKTINYCNTVLHFARLAQENDATFTEHELNIYESEVRAIRALSYFYLVRSYKEVPLVLNATLNDKSDFYIPKSSEAEIIKQIIADLTSAAGILPDGYAASPQYDKGRMTKGAALAILADVYLWNNNFDKCIDACNAIRSLNKYQLVDGDDWFDRIFFRGNSTEGIFELQFDNIFSTLRNYFYFANPTFKIATTVPGLYADEPTDRRAELATFEIFTSTIYKFAGVDPKTFQFRSDQQFYNTWIFYRFADVLLMEAEGYLNSPTRQNSDSAYYLINLVHERATGIPLSNADLVEALQKERQKEFAFEGKRWFDLLRFARRNNFEKQSLILDMVDLKTTADNYLEIQSYYSDTASYFLPIYQEELNLNRNLIQNPYYYDK